MTDYIKREDAIYCVKSMLKAINAEDVIPATIEGAISYLHSVGWMQEHDRILTEDVAPVRHGRWERQKDKQVCSLCGAEWYYFENDVDMFGYCPRCGAVMDEEVEA